LSALLETQAQRTAEERDAKTALKNRKVAHPCQKM
jgi:hypothetical protein